MSGLSVLAVMWGERLLLLLWLLLLDTSYIYSTTGMLTAHSGHKISHSMETMEGGVVILLGPFYNMRGVFFSSAATQHPL